MHRLIGAAALGLALLATRPAIPSPYSDAFDGLLPELERRRDEEFAGTLDRTAKKQQSAVLKCLALLGGPADGFADDFRTAVSVAGLLEKAYPADFFPPGPGVAGPGDLPTLLDGALEFLHEEVVEEARRVALYRLAVPEKLAAPVGNLPAEMDALLTGQTWESRKQHAQALLKGLKRVASLRKAVDRELARGDLLLWQIDDNDYLRAPGGQCAWYEGDRTLRISGSYIFPATGSLREVDFLVGGITGPGSYPLIGLVQGTYRAGLPFAITTRTLDPGPGSLSLETADPVGRHFAGSLSCTVTGGAGPSTLGVDLRFDIRGGVTLQPGNGFP